MQRTFRWVAVTLSVLVMVGGCTGADTTRSAQRAVELGGGVRLQVPAGALPSNAQVSGGIAPIPADAPSMPTFPVAGAVDITTSVQPSAPVVVAAGIGQVGPATARHVDQAAGRARTR